MRRVVHSLCARPWCVKWGDLETYFPSYQDAKEHAVALGVVATIYSVILIEVEVLPAVLPELGDQTGMEPV